MAKKPMSENARKILDYLKGAGVGARFSTKDLMTALNFEKTGSVTGTMTSLVNKGYAEKDKVETQNEEGKTSTVTVYWLNDAGMAFDPDAEVEE